MSTDPRVSDNSPGSHPGAPEASEEDYRDARERIASVEHWYHQIEVLPGLVTPGVNNSTRALSELPLPDDLSGRRVLDIGARDGFFSFECERRGADVLAVDQMPADETGFQVTRDLLGSQVKFQQDNVYNLSAERYGEFDLVLFLGVLYHLRDPLLALDRIWDVCRGRLIVETQLLDNAFQDSSGEFRTLASVAPELEKTAVMQFYPGGSLNEDPTCVWAPNSTCLRAMLTSAGFEVDHETTVGRRGIAAGTKASDGEEIYWRNRDRAVV
jgi:tRNA (mo5U34)-methyltransferase